MLFMQKKLIIVDDFYTNPDAVRDVALKAEYKAEEGHTYPGENSKEALVLPGIEETFKKILGPNIAPSEVGLFGHFRISKGSDHFEQDIHVDPPTIIDEFMWAGVLYLNKPEQYMKEDGTTRDGTLLWRHKERDLERTPLSPKEGKAMGFKDYEEVRKEIIYKDGHDRSKWELMHRVPMKYNRITFFRPWYWHSHGENFGTTRDNSRLVQIFFFRVGR